MHTNSQVILPDDIIFHDECRDKLDKLNCRKKVYVFILQFLVTICVCSILSMFVINEQISISINDAPNVLRSALKDIEFFVKSSNHQLQSETFDQFDKAREKIKIDLEDIDKLLGERIIREISFKTGLDITFESTGLILESTRNLSGRVQHLLNDVVVKTLMFSADAASKVDDIIIQLSVLQRQCSSRDRPLCDTLKVKSFEEVGFIEKLKFLNYNSILQKLRSMNENLYDNNLKELTDELAITKKVFRNYSYQLKQDSARQKEEIMKQISIMRSGLNETIQRLSSVVKNVLDRIGAVWQKVLPIMDNFNEAGYISWLIGLITCTSTLVVTLFLIVPLSCSCCHVDNIAGITFQMSACILSIFCTFLGFFTIFEVLIGGHGEVFVCRALYEKPEYFVIGRLFDNPGIMYDQAPTNGILTNLLVSSEHNLKQFSNVSLKTALTECEMNKSAYNVFQIDNLLDLKNTLNFKNYPDLVRSINNIKAHESQFISLTERIQYFLSELYHESNFNFTSFRLDIQQISPEKEMTNFIDQMQRVSLQINDASTANRMATLASVAIRIQKNMLIPLEILKNDIIFEVTALELQIKPWMEKIKEIETSYNQTQVFLNQNAQEICANFSEGFRNRLRMNLESFKDENLEKLNTDYGCQSLFDVFDGIRLLTCGHIIEPINGLFFISFILLILWVISTPVSLLLASTYAKIESTQQKLCRTNSHRSYNEGPTIDEIVNRNREVTWSSRPQTSIDSNW
ncbi:hypothetical protein ACKWTF_012345 [Chironomus riparius]